MSSPDDPRAADLLRRLVNEPGLRQRFRRDPAAVCAEFGLVDLSQELQERGNVLQTLEVRESRSSLAGALIAAAGEGMAALHSGGGIEEHASSASDAPGTGSNLGDASDSAQLDETLRQLAEVHYGFIRDSTSGVDYHQILAAGYNGVLFHANDPHLAEAISQARAAGIPDVGIWAPANGEDPDVFAQRLAALSEYKPSMVVPDIEIEGKGYPGSPQWDWTEEFAKAYRQLQPHQVMGAAVMGEDDFNYAALTSRDVSIWPMTYGATYQTTFDPISVIKRVVANGVDPRLINPILAPNQSGAGLGHYASYALDDFGGVYPHYTPGGAVEPIDGAVASPDHPAPTAPAAPPDSGSSAGPSTSSAGESVATPPSEPAEVGSPVQRAASDSGVFDVLRPGRETSDPHSTVQFLAAVEPHPGHGSGASDAAGLHGAGADAGASDALPDPTDVYPGDGAAREEIAGWMARQAHKAGLPGELPVMAALTESGLRNLQGGDLDSYGFYQMRESIWGRQGPEQQLRWFIDQALDVRQKQIAAGDSAFGLDDGSWGSWIVGIEHPARIYEDRYQLELDEARRLLGAPGADHVHHAAVEAVEAAAIGSAAARGEAAVQYAQRFLGLPYRWGGTDLTRGVDCSGFADAVYAHFGVHLPRVAADQFEVGIHVDRASLAPGDLIFFRDGRGYIHHEAIYIGGDKFIHAPHTGDVVKISSLDEPYYAQQFAGGRRVAGLADGDVQPEPAGQEAPVAEPATPATGDSGAFAALGSEHGDASTPPHSTVQFLPAVSPEDEQHPSD